MNRTVIIARLTPGSAPAVAEIFGRSDATELPHEIGVTQRALYTFHDLYLHVIDFDRPPGEAMAVATSRPGFRAISDELTPHITAYDPGWRSPADAMARPFYLWSATDVVPVP